MLFMNIYHKRRFFLLYINVVETIRRDGKDNTSRRKRQYVATGDATHCLRRSDTNVPTEDKYCEHGR